ETCKKRDPHGLYKKVLRGKIPEFTGISSPYETPVDPEISVNTDQQGMEEIINMLAKRLIIEGIITTLK
ncbi:MAG: adenylyl-sulfate kinase, partial [Smithella sp.]